jgi:hypothetical protein
MPSLSMVVTFARTRPPMTMLIAGEDTTSASLAWTVHLHGSRRQRSTSAEPGSTLVRSFDVERAESAFAERYTSLMVPAGLSVRLRARAGHLHRPALGE